MIKSSGFLQARYPLKKEWNLRDADMLSNKEYWQGKKEQQMQLASLSNMAISILLVEVKVVASS